MTMLLWYGRATGAQPKPAVRLEDLTHPEMGRRDVRLLLLPIGSTEPHANHLCYGNDNWTAEALAVRAAAAANEKGARVVVLPTMPYGVNTNVAPVPFAQSIRPATMMQFVKDVVDTAERQGIRKLVILDSHGGNKTTLGAALRELRAREAIEISCTIGVTYPHVSLASLVVELRLT